MLNDPVALAGIRKAAVKRKVGSLSARASYKHVCPNSVLYTADCLLDQLS